MEKAEISIHAELKSLILQVRESKENQEIALKESFKEFAHSLSPFEMTKSAFHELVEDKGVQFDLLKGGMNLGASYLIESTLNKNSSVKGFFSSLLLEKLSSSFIQANAGKIIMGVTNLFSRKNKQTEAQPKHEE